MVIRKFCAPGQGTKDGGDAGLISGTQIGVGIKLCESEGTGCSQ